jgi:hypothetical protein
MGVAVIVEIRAPVEMFPLSIANSRMILVFRLLHMPIARIIAQYKPTILRSTSILNYL